MHALRVGAAALIAGAGIFLVASPAGAAPLPSQLPECQYNQHPETHPCKYNYDDPFGVWENELDDTFLGR